MPKQSKVTNRIFDIPKFKSEAEEAEWWFANRDRVGELIAKHGRIVPGRKVEPTKAISLRISEIDLERAKRLAKKQGIGYQTVLKEAIREGLKKTG
jgi:predicted DNA binding CopG/RHH family protein